MRSNRISWIWRGILALICLVLIVSILIQIHPGLIGADSSFTVLSGSMQPALYTHDLIFTKKVQPADIHVGDIITIQNEVGVFTHRVVDKVNSGDSFLFQTKGDANEDPDLRYVRDSEVTGKVVYIIPWRHLYTPYGYFILVLIPLCLLIVKQFIKMYQFLNMHKRKIVRRSGLKAWLQQLTGIERRRRLRKIQVLDTTSVLLLFIIVANSTRTLAPRLLGGGYSYFSDVETAGGQVAAGTWHVPSSMTCNVSPNPMVNLGENVTISGAINPPRIGVNIQIEFKLNGTAHKSVSVPTDNNGAYNYVFIPDEAGNWNVKVSWLGDSNYSGSSCEVTVQVLS